MTIVSAWWTMRSRTADGCDARVIVKHLGSFFIDLVGCDDGGSGFIPLAKHLEEQIGPDFIDELGYSSVCKLCLFAGAAYVALCCSLAHADQVDGFIQAEMKREHTKSGVTMVDASSSHHSQNAKTAHASTGESLEGPRVGPPRNCEGTKIFIIDRFTSNVLQMTLSQISEDSLVPTPDFVPLS